MKIVHIGLMKSGTTFVQNAFARSREKLADHGVLYPGELFNQQHACYGICGSDIPWVSPRRKWTALGESMLQEIREHDGDILIASEALSSMDANAVDRFCGQLGGIDCVVITVRNFPRMLLSAWQQSIKGGSKATLSEFFERLEQQRKKGSGLWRTYAFGQIAGRWTQHARVELIVVGESNDASQDPLLVLFGRIIGVSLEEPEKLSESERNISLFFEDVEVLRHINALFKKMTRLDRERMIRRLLKRTFFPAVSKANGNPIKFPYDYLEKAQEWAQEEIDALPKEVAVTGNLTHLKRVSTVPVGHLAEMTQDACFRRFAELVAQEGK